MQHNYDQVFEKYCNGEELSELELQLLYSEPNWRERIQTINQLKQLNESDVESESMPKWHRSAGFKQHHGQGPFWSQQGLSLTAMVFSVFATVAVLLNVNISLNDDGLHISSNQQMMEKKLMEQQTRMQQQWLQQLQQFEQQQKENLTEVAGYLFDSTRKERREDIRELVDYLQEQRQEDLAYMREQLTDLNKNESLVRNQY